MGEGPAGEAGLEWLSANLYDRFRLGTGPAVGFLLCRCPSVVLELVASALPRFVAPAAVRGRPLPGVDSATRGPLVLHVGLFGTTTRRLNQERLKSRIDGPFLV